MRKKAFFLILTLILIPFFCFGENIASESLREMKETGEERIETGKGLLNFSKNLWKEEIKPFLGKIWESVANFWKNSIKPLFQKEIEKRKPAVEEEIKETKEEVPELKESLWERLKGIIGN